MSGIFWESEDISYGSLTIRYHYMYITYKCPFGGALDNNGNVDTEAITFIHPKQGQMLKEFITWRPFYAIFEGGIYHYAFHQTNLPLGKSMAWPITEGNSPFSGDEYLFSAGGIIIVSSLDPVSAYNGMTRHDFTQRRLNYGGGVSMTINSDSSVFSTPSTTGFVLIPFTQFTATLSKGILMDQTGSATQPSIGQVNQTGAYRLRSDQVVNVIGQFRTPNTSSISTLRLTYSINGVQVIQDKPPAGNFPDGSFDIYFAEFQITLALTGQHVSSTSKSVTNLDFALGSGKVVAEIREASPNLKPPAYNTGTTDGNILEGGYDVL